MPRRRRQLQGEWRIPAHFWRKSPLRFAYSTGRIHSTMNLLLKDCLAAIRQFRRRPWFALTVVSALALAIGANLAVFSVLNAVLFRALPFKNPERLVWIASVRSDNPSAPFTMPEFIDYRSQTRSLAGLWKVMLARCAA